MEIEAQIKDIMAVYRKFWLNQEFKSSQLQLSEIQDNLNAQWILYETLFDGLSFEDRYEWIALHKTKGKLQFELAKLDSAFKEYMMALLAINDSKLFIEFGVDLVNNVGMIALKKDDSEVARQSFETVITYDFKNIKAYWRLGKVQHTLCLYDEAINTLNCGIKRCNDSGMISEMKDILRRVQQDKQRNR